MKFQRFTCYQKDFTINVTNNNWFTIIFQAITELGVVIYSALDFGLREAEERQLTPGLETLLDLMTSLGK